MFDSSNLSSFAEALDQLIRGRGVRSDEELARRAMKSQKGEKDRVNVQRRTINNWRRGRSAPRSADDRQFLAVARALNVSDQEFMILSGLLKEESSFSNAAKLKAHQGNKHPPVPAGWRTYMRNPRYWVTVALIGVSALIATSMLYPQSTDVQPRSYLGEVPDEFVSLSSDGFVFPNSDTRRITSEELDQLTGWELYLARNEIYARRGWIFRQPSSVCLTAHFNRYRSNLNDDGWYTPRQQPEVLSQLESDNARVIQRYECLIRGGQFTCNGRSNPC